MPDTFPQTGLRFQCLPNCGNCCAQPGEVFVTRDEIRAMAAHQGLPIREFRRRYVRRAGGELTLIGREDGGCVFLGDDRRCKVYPARPTQCRTYPFWPEVLADATTWEWEGLKCPGIGTGDIVPLEAIMEMREASRR